MIDWRQVNDFDVIHPALRKRVWLTRLQSIILQIYRQYLERSQAIIHTHAAEIGSGSLSYIKYRL